jgi:hypothetical protein
MTEAQHNDLPEDEDITAALDAETSPQVVTPTPRDNSLRTVQNLATARPVAHEGVICGQHLTVFGKHVDRPDGAARLALNNLYSGPLGIAHPALRPIVEKYDHWICVEALLRELILDGSTVILDLLLVQDAGIDKLRESVGKYFGRDSQVFAEFVKAPDAVEGASENDNHPLVT